MIFFLFVFYFYFKQRWMLQEISVFHIVLCLLMDLKEDGRGGFNWDLGSVLKSVPTALVGLVQEPWEHLLARQDFIPCFSSQPIAALFHFALLKKRRCFTPTRRSFLSEPQYDSCHGKT